MIRLERVTKRYPGGQVAVRELTIEFPTGQLTMLVGPSGCGKTTTLKMINRLIEPSDGRIFHDEQDVTHVDPVALRLRMGYVIQNVGLFPHLSIADNVATVPRLLGWDKKRIQQRVNELFRRAQRMRVSRTVVATVAMQDDYMKRVRGGGGARDQLRDEGIVIFGDYAGDQVLAAALGLPRPGPGEFVSARLAPRPAGPGDRVYARSIRLAGADWLLASAADPAAAAPALPR